ncbi:MAG: L-fuculokinase [Saprospiraceae bacterium]|jgi:L-fuculokinase
MSHTLIFDIGKTNKKCFVFDEDYKEVWKEYIRIDEIVDEDGDPCDDLQAIEEWVKSTFNKVLDSNDFVIKGVNFSTYGASFVHLDKNGQPVTALYNYLKPFPKELLDQFYEKYGSEISLAKETASPPLEMLNSGLQLYYLKYAKPELYNRIHRSLHLPQYLSFLFTGVAVSEFTSIGCHTMLWDYSTGDYHQWVYAEGIDSILAPIVSKKPYLKQKKNGVNLKYGIGIHDSSAALIPYLKAQKKPFLLISTGTWSISLNPFSKELLSEADLRNDALNFMQLNGDTVKASRLFLGNEYKIQVEFLREDYGKEEGYHRQMKFSPTLYSDLSKDSKICYNFSSINIERNEPEQTNLIDFGSYEEAYHKLMIELVALQTESAKRAIGNTQIDKIFIDGGFAANDIFVKLIGFHFKDCKIRTTLTPLGSALGAALVLSNKKVKRKFLKKHYALQKPKIWN